MANIVRMRSLMVTSIGVTCAAALTLPLAAPALSAPVPHASSARPPSAAPWCAAPRPYRMPKEYAHFLCMCRAV
ncbi:hypothetical protein ACSTAL_30050, partial [Streptomyces californicus]